ncbi:MAG: SMI1/KNR4 family protein [Polyangiales bacterium]
MADDIEDQPVDELELGPKALAFVSALEVETLGELLALPEIRGPRRVIEELESLFGDLGVDYAGELVPTDQRTHRSEAAPDVAERWHAIAAWLEANEPSALDDFLPPASPRAMADAERVLGHELPRDYKRFLAIHDGQSVGAPMVEGCSLLPIDRVASEHARLVRRLVDGKSVDEDDVDEGIRAVRFSKAWIPVGRSAGGRDYVCLDLDPAPGGTPGQAILLHVDDDARGLLAKSFSDLLALYLEQLEEGEIDFEEEARDEEDEEDDEDEG